MTLLCCNLLNLISFAAPATPSSSAEKTVNCELGGEGGAGHAVDGPAEGAGHAVDGPAEGAGHAVDGPAEGAGHAVVDGLSLVTQLRPL